MTRLALYAAVIAAGGAIALPSVAAGGAAVALCALAGWMRHVDQKERVSDEALERMKAMEAIVAEIKPLKDQVERLNLLVKR